jgi:heat shock protein HslJ
MRAPSGSYGRAGGPSLLVELFSVVKRPMGGLRMASSAAAAFVIIATGACGGRVDETVGAASASSTTSEISRPSTTPPTTTVSTTTSTTYAPTSTTVSDYGAALMGRRFSALAAFDGSEPHAFAPNHGRPFVRFERRDYADIVSWSGGCNQFGTEVEVTQTRLTLRNGGSSTAVGCDPQGEAQDGWVGRLMGSDPMWHLDPDGTHLTLEAHGQRLVLASSEPPSSS